MLVELTVNWTYLTTPVVPFPAIVYWRLKGGTSYSNVNVADGTTATITTINDSSTTLNTTCILEYEGYVIPLCFVGDATDCNPFLSDGVTLNPACSTSNRSYWDATVDATNNQSCRGVEVSCTKSGVYAIHAVDPDLMFQQTYLNGVDGVPNVIITNQGIGNGFSAIAFDYDAFTGYILQDCWIVTQGQNYNSTPTITLSPSDTGEVIVMEVTMACNDFTYKDCKSGTQTSGQVLLGESRTVCMPNFEYSGFTPTATNSVFEKSLGGCCTGNGKKYTLTFTSPDPAAYPKVDYTYVTANTLGTAQTSATLFHGVPYTTSNCIVIGSFAAITPSPEIPCQTDSETNAWLFNNHVLISNPVDC